MDLESSAALPTLKVLFPHEYPSVSTSCVEFPFLRTSKNCPFPGLMVEIFMLLAETAQFEIEPIVVNDTNHYGNLLLGLPRKNSTGLMQHVQTQMADTVAYPFQMTIDRRKHFSFSDKLYEVELNILRRRIDLGDETLFSFFTVYDKVSYSVALIILVLQAFFFFLNEFCADQLGRTTFGSLNDSVWNAVKMQLGMPVFVGHQSYGVKFNTVFVSTLQSVVVLGIYSSWILTQKYANDTRNDLNTFHDLIRNVLQGKYFFADATASNWFYEAVNHSASYPYRDLRAALRVTPLVVTGSSYEALELASGSNGLVAVMQDALINYKSKRFCNLIPLDRPMAVVTSHLLFRRGSPFVPLINHAITANRLKILRVWRKYLGVAARLEGQCAAARGSAPVQPYLGLVLVWLCLVGAAGALLLLECAVHHTAARLRRRRSTRRTRD